MCNFLHQDSVPIEKEGIGYKVFSIEYNQILPAFRMKSFSYNKWNKWDNSFIKGEGFCFCLTVDEALKIYHKIKTVFPDENFVVYEIKYRKGLGTHIEKNIIENIPFQTALCKEFIIWED